MSDTPKPYRYDLWKFFSDNHGLTLLESELQDIVAAVNSQLERELNEVKAVCGDRYPDARILDVVHELRAKLDDMTKEAASVAWKLRAAEVKLKAAVEALKVAEIFMDDDFPHERKIVKDAITICEKGTK